MTGRITATPRAAETVRGLAAVHGPVVFHQSGGCCDGSSPMCLPAGELPPGPGDALLGEIAGAPFYIDADQDRRWGHPELLIDVLPGAATSLSLEGAQDLHFIARAPIHPRTRRPPDSRVDIREGAPRICPRPPRPSRSWSRATDPARERSPS